MTDLSRFDLAERAYWRTIDLQGKTPAVLNNLGYHYLLRGQLVRRAKHLLSASSMDPTIHRFKAIFGCWRLGKPDLSLPESEIVATQRPLDCARGRLICLGLRRW